MDFNAFFTKPTLRYVEHDIVNHCNLNCSGCTHFSPLAKPWYEDLTDFIKNFSELKNKFNVKKIRLMGGEPLLHPQVKEFLVACRRIFPYAQIHIVTNAILMQKDQELIDVINKNAIIVSVTDYGIINNLNERLAGINRTIVTQRHTMYNMCFKAGGDAAFAYANCIPRISECNFFQDGKMYPCAQAAKSWIFNENFAVKLPLCEGITVADHTAQEILDYVYRTPVDLCGYCDVKAAKNSYHTYSISKLNEKEWIGDE